MKRGEIWRAEVDEPCSVVYLSAVDADMVRAILIVAPAQRKIDWVVEIDVGPLEGHSPEGVVRVALPRDGFIPCNWLVTLSRGRLLNRVGTLSSEQLGELDEVLRRAGLE